MIVHRLSFTEAQHHRGMTIAATAAALKISESMASKIEQQALAKLRHMLEHRHITLRDFLGRDAGVDENAPFDGVAAPEIEA